LSFAQKVVDLINEDSKNGNFEVDYHFLSKYKYKVSSIATHQYSDTKVCYMSFCDGSILMIASNHVIKKAVAMDITNATVSASLIVEYPDKTVKIDL